MDVAFAPDGETVYVTRVVDSRYTIMESKRVASGWSALAPVSFSGQWRDLEEVLSPDGNAMIFASNRPIENGGKAIDAYYRERYSPQRGGNLWIVHRAGGGWGTPSRLPDAINANTSTFSPALAADGTLYFMRAYGPGGKFHIFVAKEEDGTYRSSSLAPFSDMRYSEFDPTVSADGAFVIFSSSRPPTPPKHSDLFVTFNAGGKWSAAEDMGAAINPAEDSTEARLAPDGTTLYLSSSANNGIVSANVAGWTDGSKGFNFLMGTWRTHYRLLKTRLANSHDWYDCYGTSSVRPFWNGGGDVEDGDLRCPGSHIVGVTVRLYNAQTHEWSLWWGTQKRGLVPPPQVGRFENGVGDFFARDKHNGKPIVIRFRWKLLPGDHPRFEQAFSPDNGKTWETNWTTDYTRV